MIKKKSSVFRVVQTAAKKENYSSANRLIMAQKKLTHGIRFSRKLRRKSISHENWDTLKQVFREKSKTENAFLMQIITIYNREIERRVSF